MTRKKRSLTLSIEEHEKAQLEHLALEFDQKWGDSPNLSKLMKAIAQGKLRLAANHNWSRDRINILNQIFNWLKDWGELNAATEIAYLLLERSELNTPLRQEIQHWVNQPSAPWRAHLESYIRRQRPFCLTYQDAAERILNFTIRHARIERYEDRQYLDCWCDETDHNRDIEALQHNWSLRIDRIPHEATISPTDGHWQPELSHVQVEFYLLNHLAFAYRTKTEADLINEWLPEQRVRRIVRRIHHTFWFFREIRRYGANSIIIGPQDVRERFVQDMTGMVQHYLAPPPIEPVGPSSDV